MTFFLRFHVRNLRKMCSWLVGIADVLQGDSHVAEKLFRKSGRGPLDVLLFLRFRPSFLWVIALKREDIQDPAK